MQVDTFPRTSSARNPFVIVKIFIFIFLSLLVVLQAKPCKGGRCSDTKKLHISACRGRYNLKVQSATVITKKQYSCLMCISTFCPPIPCHISYLWRDIWATFVKEQ